MGTVAGGLVARAQVWAAWRNSAQGELSGGPTATALHLPCSSIPRNTGPSRTSLCSSAAPSEAGRWPGKDQPFPWSPHVPFHPRERAPRLPRVGSVHTPHTEHTHHSGTPRGRHECHGPAEGRPRRAAVTERWALASAGGERPHPSAPTPPPRTLPSAQAEPGSGPRGGLRQRRATHVHTGRPPLPQQPRRRRPSQSSP